MQKNPKIQKIKNSKIKKKQRVFRRQDSNCFCFVYFVFLLFSIFLFVLIFIFLLFFCRFFFPFLFFNSFSFFHLLIFFIVSSFFGWCCLVSSLFGWSLQFGGAAFHPLHWVGLLFPMSSSWFLPSLGGLSCLAVLPSFSSFGCGSFFPCLLLGGAVWFHPSFWVVWLFFPSPVGWCCLPSPPLGGVVLLGLLLLLVVLLFFLLLFGGAAFLLLLLVGLLHPPSSVGWCCFSFLLGGVVVFSFSCWVALLGLLLPRRCFPLLLRGAAWFLPSLGGLSCLVLLPSIPSSGQFHPSSVGWCCLVSSSFWVVLRFPSPFAWYFLVSSFLGVVFLCLYLGLLGFFTLWVVSPVWWCCLHLLFWVWVVLLGLLLLLVVLLFFLLLLFGGAAFLLLLLVGLLHPPSSVGWCCLVLSFLLGGVVVVSFSCWVALLGLLLLGDVFLSFYVVLLGFFPLWVVSPVWWCCLPSPPLGGAAFSHVFFLVSSLFGWSLLFGGAAFIRSFGCGSFFHVFCWVVLFGLLHLLGGVACFSFSCLVVLPSFSSFGWGGAARSPPPFGGVAVFPSPVRWCCLPSPPFGGTASSPVFCWVVLLLLPFGCCCCCFSLLLLRGAAWSPPSLALFSSPFTWCCLVSSLFGWSLLFGGFCLPPPPLGGAALSPVFCWVVLLGLLLLLVVLLFFLLLFGGAAFLLLLWVVQLFPMSSVAWCCLVSSVFGVVFLSF